MQTLLPHCSLATVNSITWSNLKCWLVLERLSGLGSSLIICFLTHKQPCPLCSPVQLTIAISGWWALCCHCVQLPRAANFLFFYRNLLPTTLPLLQRAPQQCHREKERHKENDALIKVTHTEIRKKQHRSPVSSPPPSGVPKQETFHIGTLILVLPLLAQSFLSVRNTLSSILQNQFLIFYLNVDYAVHNASDENSKLC